MKYTSIFHKEKDPAMGTMLGFVQDLTIVQTYHGVYCLLSKHFIMIEEDTNKALYRTNDGKWIICFTYKNSKKKSRKVWTCECYCSNNLDKRTLLWKQEQQLNEYPRIIFCMESLDCLCFECL